MHGSERARWKRPGVGASKGKADTLWEGPGVECHLVSMYSSEVVMNEVESCPTDGGPDVAVADEDDAVAAVELAFDGDRVCCWRSVSKGLDQPSRLPVCRQKAATVMFIGQRLPMAAGGWR
jgi:hypothetical protein